MYQIIADFQTMHLGCFHYCKICSSYIHSSITAIEQRILSVYDKGLRYAQRSSNPSIKHISESFIHQVVIIQTLSVPYHFSDSATKRSWHLVTSALDRCCFISSVFRSNLIFSASTIYKTQSVLQTLQHQNPYLSLWHI